jgi:Uma2 family endonuclease
MASLPKVRITVEDYLARDRAAAYKSEFLAGEVFAMAGASRVHNLIVFNLATVLGPQLQGRPCEAYVSDMRVKVSATGLYAYPDLVVVCGEPRFEDAQLDTLLNPTLIIEVLSPSTETYDRDDKFVNYCQIESLQQYVLIAQDDARIERFDRVANELWTPSAAAGLDTTISVAAIGCDLPLSRVYERVKFGDPPTAQ